MVAQIRFMKLGGTTLCPNVPNRLFPVEFVSYAFSSYPLTKS
jgi:hypothetical protein